MTLGAADGAAEQGGAAPTPVPHGAEQQPDAGGSGVRATVPVRRADPRLALVALAVLCAVCIAIGFVLGRTL